MKTKTTREDIEKKYFKRPKSIVTVTLNADLLKKYTAFMEKEGMIISKRFEILMRKDLEENENHLDK